MEEMQVSKLSMMLLAEHKETGDKVPWMLHKTVMEALDQAVEQYKFNVLAEATVSIDDDGIIALRIPPMPAYCGKKHAGEWLTGELGKRIQ